eukprot:6072447-Amphidinium_carterae.3
MVQAAQTQGTAEVVPVPPDTHRAEQIARARAHEFEATNIDRVEERPSQRVRIKTKRPGEFEERSPPSRAKLEESRP